MHSGDAEGITAVEVDICQAFLVDGKRRTLAGSVFVNAAHGDPVFFNEKWTAKKNFTAVPASVALSLPEHHLPVYVVLLKVDQYKTSDFSGYLFDFLPKFEHYQSFQFRKFSYGLF